jgi:hypothetical protein
VKYPHTIKTRLMVHPKTVQVPYHAVSKAGLMGNSVVQRWINKDPLLYSGFREYDYTDSIKDIDWKLSAKSNQLLVKNYDATSDPSIVFMYAIIAYNLIIITYFKPLSIIHIFALFSFFYVGHFL